MRNQLFEELAKLYGIEIQYGLQGNGGLYYTDSNDTLQKLDTIFDEEFSTTRRESETIRQLVEERHRQKMTQQEIADITGIKPSNMARFESGGRVPTLVVLEKYANALGKHIEIKICDD